MSWLTMEWRVEPEDEASRQRHRQGQGRQFDYWGGTLPEELEEGNILEPNLPGSCNRLSQCQVGERVWLIGFQGKGGIKRLLGMGLTPGVELQVISSQPSGSVLVAIQDNRIGIGAGMAQKIFVSDKPLRKSKDKNMVTETNTLMREMPVGTKGQVVGYDRVRRGYKGKLLSMGLTPGTEFTVIRVAPLGDPIEILVRGFHLSLRKYEADALVVKTVESQD